MARLGLPLAEWPVAWQQRWQAAVAPAAGPFAESGAGAYWSPDTRREMRKRLEQFFGYLARNGHLASVTPVADWLSEPVLRGYVEELQARVATATVSGYVRDLRIGLKALAPEADVSILALVSRRLARSAKPTRDKTAPGLSPALLLAAGLKRMDRVDAAPYEKEDVRAVQYGDGLAMAIVSVTAIRLKNLVGIRIGRELRQTDGTYRLDFPASAMKGRRPFGIDLPHGLNAYLERYIDRHRSRLLLGRPVDHLFISTYRGPMCRQTMYCRFKDATGQELGTAISPHQARDLATTWIATAHPEKIGMMPALLHHARLRTTQAHYNQADQISASRSYTGALEELRRDALLALRDGGLFEKKEPTA